MIAVKEEEKSELSIVESIVRDYGLINGSQSGHLVRSLGMARAINELRKVVDRMMPEIQSLQGTRLGFVTDKDRDGQPYPPQIVRECCIEALLRGARLVGNEFNIIAGRCYLTREYYSRAVGELEGVSDLTQERGVSAVMGDKGALVPYVVTWNHHGKTQRLERLLRKNPDGTEFDGRIPVRVNAGMGADAILGKAERKMLKVVYERITGSAAFDDDDERTVDARTVDASRPPTALETKLGVGGERVDADGEIVDAPPAGNLADFAEPEKGTAYSKGKK